jgi:predicted nucleic acid-binding protein
VIAALSSWHEQHAVAAAALRDISSVPAHVLVEAYAVLTRLPGGVAVPATTAADVLSRRFGDSPLTLPDEERAAVIARLADAGAFGGATYDGLVALEAAAHGEALVTLDRRAQGTYQRSESSSGRSRPERESESGRVWEGIREPVVVAALAIALDSSHRVLHFCLGLHRSRDGQLDE